MDKKELLHLETIRERLNKIKDIVGESPLHAEFSELLDLVKDAIETSDTSLLEEWAR